jgi:hypothetical protein
MKPDGERTRIVIMGAAGRDFHDFNMLYRDDPAFEVVAFTAAQIPGIAGRRYPPSLAGPLPIAMSATGMSCTWRRLRLPPGPILCCRGRVGRC